MDKQNTHNGILFGLKKEGNSAKCYNMDEENKILSLKSQTEKASHCMIPLIWNT